MLRENVQMARELIEAWTSVTSTHYSPRLPPMLSGRPLVRRR